MRKLKLTHVLEKNIHSEIQTESRTEDEENFTISLCFSDRSMVENRKCGEVFEEPYTVCI